MVVVLVGLSMIVVGITLMGGRDQQLSTTRREADQAQVAAQGAAEMAVREIYRDADEDGDGIIGSISDDGDPNTDPVFGGVARGSVTQVVSGLTTTLTATGRTDHATRKFQVALNNAYMNTPSVFFPKSGVAQVWCSLRDTSNNWSTAALSGTVASTPIYVVARSRPQGGIVVGESDSSADFWIGLADSTTGAATYQRVCLNVKGTNTRAFDIACEAAGGRAYICWWDETGGGGTKDLKWCTYDGATLSGTTNANLTNVSVEWVTMVPRRAGQQILVLTLNDQHDINAMWWNGTTLGAPTKLYNNTNSPNYECYCAAYERLSDRLMFVYADHDNRLYYRTYTTAGGWSAATLIDDIGCKPRWPKLTAKTGTNEMMLCVLGDDQRLYWSKWSGSSWSVPAQIGSSTGHKDRRMFDISYTPNGSGPLICYAKNNNSVYYQVWNGSSWGGELTGPNLGDKAQIFQLRPGRLPNEVLGAVSDDANEVTAFRWAGGSLLEVTSLIANIGGSDNRERFWADAGLELPRLQSVTYVAP